MIRAGRAWPVPPVDKGLTHIQTYIHTYTYNYLCGLTNTGGGCLGSLPCLLELAGNCRVQQAGKDGHSCIITEVYLPDIINTVQNKI